MTRTRSLVAGVAAVLLVFSASASANAGSAHAQKLTVTIGTPSRALDMASPANLAVAPGVPIHLTLTNYTHEFHTFVVPRLGLSFLVSPAQHGAPSTTTVTFTIQKLGTFAWRCVICASGQHGKRHSMAGRIYSIISPSVV